MKVDLLLAVDHMAVPCGVRTTYLKFIEWCQGQGISLALISDTSEHLPYTSVRTRINLSIDEGYKINALKRRPLLSLIDENSQMIHPDLIHYGISHSGAFHLDAWRGNQSWLHTTQQACESFLDKVESSTILIATQSFIGFAMSAVLKDENASVCLHTNYPSTYAIRITSVENKLFELLAEKIRERLAERFMGRSRQVFLTTETSKRFFNIGDDSKVDIFGPGVDTRLFKPKYKRAGKKLSVLYVGRWSQEKGTQLLLSLFKAMPAIGLTIIGNEPTHENNIFPTNVRQLGIVDLKSMASLMASADVLIFYGKWDTFGLVALEALSCGVPVLAYQDSEMARLIGLHGCGLSFGSFEHLMDLIGMLQGNRARLEELSVNARNFAKSMTWENSFSSFAKKLGM